MRIWWLCGAVAAVALAQTTGDWSWSDVGNVTVPGAVSIDGNTMTISVAGADIWGTADAFCYAWRPLAGDGSITARVRQIDRADDWSKAGVMIRGSLDPGAPYVYCCLTPRNGASLQYRPKGGEGALEGGRLPDCRKPLWVHLDRAGNHYVAQVREGDGGEWQQLGAVDAEIGEHPLVGVAVTSHAYKIAAKAVVEQVMVTAR